MRSPVAWCGTVLLMLCFSPCVHAQKKADPRDVSQLVAQGDEYINHRDYGRAMQSYEKAEKLSQHACSVCLLREIKIYKRAGDFDAALGCAKKAVTEAGNNKTEMAYALLVHASLLAALSSKPKDKKLVQAVSDTRQALALNPQETIARFNLGVLLMKQEQDADGTAELKAYLASNNTDMATAKTAREDIADPRRAREPSAPDFSFTTLDNEQVSLASLRGKVVLLDFWATWCPPCRASLPTIARLQKDFSKKGVEFISISDDNEDAWRKFIASNHMDWAEYHDGDDRVESAFVVDSIPTYIVLDRNGVIRFRQSGFDEQESGGEISNALGKALKEKPEAPAPSLATPANAAPDTSGPSAVSPSSAGNAAGQASEAVGTNAASGNPEPTYIPLPTKGASDDSAPRFYPNGRFTLALRIITPLDGLDFRSFATTVSTNVKARWLSTMPQGAREGKQGRVVVDFRIGRDGKLAGAPRMDTSSGDDALDNGALAAVSAAAPFSTLPDDSPSEIQVQAFFLYNETAGHIQTSWPQNR